MKKPKVSVIIPVKAINDYIRESIPKILELNSVDFEIIIFTDRKENNSSFRKTRIIVSGPVGPAQKRDLAMRYAKGEILAFLDDDAYPEKNWLKKALKHFKNPKIAAVGGPAITPDHDSMLQKMSGAISESYIGSGYARNRFLSIGQAKFVDDWPTVNLLIRKNIFKKLGGFNSAYWPGEDTKLCLDIIKACYKIIYEPKAIVYHHRRNNILNHFKQIGNYGLHRGYFAKKYPQTSCRLWYFVPTFFDIYLLSIMLWFFIGRSDFLLLYSVPLFIYWLGLLIDGLIISVRWKNPWVGLLTIPMIFLTHVWYGIRFFSGLVIPKLER